MTGYEPDQGFRTALLRLDLTQVDFIITMDAAAAQWASDRGYLVTKLHRPDNLIYEVRPGRLL